MPQVDELIVLDTHVANFAQGRLFDIPLADRPCTRHLNYSKGVPVGIQLVQGCLGRYDRPSAGQRKLVVPNEKVVGDTVKLLAVVLHGCGLFAVTFKMVSLHEAVMAFEQKPEPYGTPKKVVLDHES